MYRACQLQGFAPSPLKYELKGKYTLNQPFHPMLDSPLKREASPSTYKNNRVEVDSYTYNSNYYSKFFFSFKLGITVRLNTTGMEASNLYDFF